MDRPNIVLVVMDTARAENFSCYGNERLTSPFLDSLAEENVKYENAFVQENWTFPSHVSIFSGEYVSDHGLDTPEDVSGIDNFVEDLSERGYRTFCYSNNPFISENFGYDEIFDEVRLTPRHELDSGLDISMEELNDRYDTEFGKYLGYLKHAVGDLRFDKVFQGLKYVLSDKLFLRDSGAARTIETIKSDLSDVEEPFFLFVNFTEPHADYKPRFPYNLKFQSKVSDLLHIPSVSDMELKQFFRNDLEPGDRVFRISEALYDGEIRYLDGKIEELFDFVEDEDTAFIVTSDHGEFFYEYGNIEHEVGLQDQGTHVPLIEVLPDRSSSVVSGPVELKGLRDHIVDLADGSNGVMSTDEVAVSEMFGNNKEHLMSYGVSEEVAERLSRYRASATDGSTRLVWLEDGEKNVYGSKEDSYSKIDFLSEKIEEFVGNPEKKVVEDKEIEADDKEIKDRLKDLGYM